MKNTLSAAITILAFGSQAAVAGVCDYKPSDLIGRGNTAAVAAGSGAVAGGGGVGTSAGLYTLKHSITGAYMLGSTAGGASAAGTVGIMGGTAGIGAAVMSVVLNPFVWIPAGATAVGVGAFEGGCYLAGE